MPSTSTPQKGRGALSNRDGRYESQIHVAIDDGWMPQDEPKVKIRLHVDHSKTIITRNQSPDVPYDQSINPYKGCEHGCVYCFARPTHAWLGYSAGMDFETEIFHKPDAVERLAEELAKKNYCCSAITLGSNTDAYQPVERHTKLTRSILIFLAECKHPVSIITKSSLIERDLDILRELAEQNLVNVLISVTTLDKQLCRAMEPRAATPLRRIQTIEILRKNNIPVGILIAPVMPVLTDHELESIMGVCHKAGALSINYVMLRLPLELKELFAEWLQMNYSLKAEHVLKRMQDMHNGELYRSEWGTRQTGSGVFADLIAQRFQQVVKKQEIENHLPPLNTSIFEPPRKSSSQMEMF